MDPIERQEKIRAAKQRLSAQRMRAGTLRGRVVVISLITFVLLWGVVFTQMATGNDPVLGDSSRTVASAKRAHSGDAKGLTAEGGGTDAEEGLGESATEAIETTEPEEVETELVEPEPVEEEVPVEEEFFEEAPVEEELIPLETSQS